MLKIILKNIPINITKNQKYDRLSKSIIKKFVTKTSNCIDIGSHRGEFLKLFLKYAPKGNHFAFEPIPQFYEKLKIKFPSNCFISNIALSNEKNKGNFHYVLSNPAYSGLKIRQYPNITEKIKLIEVATNTMDNVIPPNIKIDFIKIDVEGAELQVLKGGLKTIKRCNPIIIFEHGKGAAEFYNTKPKDIYELLNNECKLKISLMDHWIKNKKPLSREAFIEQFEKDLNYYFMAHQ